NGAIPCRSSRTSPRCSRASRPSTPSRARKNASWSATTGRWRRASIRWSRASSRSRSRLAALAVDLHRDGHAGKHDDDEDEDVHVPGDVGHGLAEEIARPAHGDDPPDAAQDVVGEKAAVLHHSPTRQHGGEGADDGHEAGDDDGLGPVLLIEVTRAQHVLGIEEERLLAREDARAQPRPDGIAHAVADDGGGDEEAVDPPDVEVARRGEEARRDEEGMYGEKAAGEKPRLRAHDAHEA